jgi:hypothetical protein
MVELRIRDAELFHFHNSVKLPIDDRAEGKQVAMSD